MSEPTGTLAPVPPTPADAPVLLNVEQVATLLNCSPRHVYRLCDAGRMPRPVRLGALVRWNRAVIEAWIEAGCPAPKGGRR